MTCHIHCQWKFHSGHTCYLFQAAVYIITHVSIGVYFAGTFVAYQREEVACLVFRIFVEDPLHFISPFDMELLSCFSAAVRYIAVPEIRLAEKSHIYKTHPAEKETHQKHVAGKIEARRMVQVQRVYFTDRREMHSPFCGLVDARVYVFEWGFVVDDVFFHCPVIGGSQYSHVKRYCIGRKSVMSEPSFVSLDEFPGDVVEADAIAPIIFFEAVEGGSVGFGSADFAVLMELGNNVFHVIGQCVFACVFFKFGSNVPAGKRNVVGVQIVNDLPE